MSDAEQVLREASINVECAICHLNSLLMLNIPETPAQRIELKASIAVARADLRAAEIGLERASAAYISTKTTSTPPV